MMVDLYKVRTAHDTVLAEDRRACEVASYLEVDTGLNNPMLLAYVSKHRPDACFLLTAHPSCLRMLPTLKGDGVLGMGIVHDGNGTASLYAPDGGIWVMAGPLDPTQPRRGRVMIARHEIKEWERFTLLPVNLDDVPLAVRHKVERLEVMLARPLDLDMIHGAQPEDGPLLQAVSRLSPQAYVEQLAADLARSPTSCGVLGRLFPDDLVAQHGLSALADYSVARDDGTLPPARRFNRRYLVDQSSVSIEPKAELASTREHTLGVEKDAIASLGRNGQYISLPYLCNSIARQKVIPTQDLCIIATARNEGVSILEWLAYHRAIGVQDVFLYTNDNDDGSDALLSCLAAAGVLRWTRNIVAVGISPQFKAYGDALTLQPEVLDYAWALILDLDEYLVCNPSLFASAIDFLHWHEASPCDAIALNWIIHGSNGAAHWSPEFIGKRFPHACEGVNVHIKSLCRPRRFLHSHAHYPQAMGNAPFVFHAASGGDHESPNSPPERSFSAKPNAGMAWINHYYYKSAEEFLWKWSRNRGDLGNVTGRSNKMLSASRISNFVRQFKIQLPALVSLDQCAPSFSAEMEYLLALPGVAAAYEQVKRLFSEQIQKIIPMFADAPGLIEADDAGRALMAMLKL